MSGNNSAPKDEWIRLNVGGKVFQTTNDTLSRYPDSFLARLVNSGIPSDKDESGAYLIDADPEHFRTISNYLRRGSVTLDASKDESGAYLIDDDPEHFPTILNYLRRGSVTLDASKAILGDLLREADFYNIEPLVIEIQHAMRINFRSQLAKNNDISKKRPSIRPIPMMEKIARMGDMCHQQPIIQQQSMIHRLPMIQQQPMPSKQQLMSHHFSSQHTAQQHPKFTILVDLLT